MDTKEDWTAHPGSVERRCLPGNLITEYWAEVKQALVEGHHLSEARAHRGIVEYRVRLGLHDAGDMIYHRDPRDIAETIASTVQHGGFKEPDEQ